jgi:hypothetical protein
MDSFGAEHIIYAPPQTVVLWSAIPTESEISKAHLEPFTAWLQEGKEGDIVVLQGEYSATFALVDFALGRGMIPVCAVTERIAREEREGEKVRREYIFEHICFRKYQYFKDLS